MAGEGGWRPLLFRTDTFDLAAWRRGDGDTLAVYIEGDGQAWLDRFHPSPDPTPRDPVSFKLADQDSSGALLYLARPCQYVEGAARRNCHPRYWTSQRYAEEVVAAMEDAIDQARRESGARRIGLVGYSGGGTIATLLAARRNDVAWLVTVAANLDPEAWSEHHGVSPLAGSLSPMGVVGSLRELPQLHLTGGSDRIVPGPLQERFRTALGPAPWITFMTIDGMDHHCCWQERWQELLTRYAPRLTHQ